MVHHEFETLIIHHNCNYNYISLHIIFIFAISGRQKYLHHLYFMFLFMFSLSFRYVKRIAYYISCSAVHDINEVTILILLVTFLLYKNMFFNQTKTKIGSPLLDKRRHFENKFIRRK
jgi:hypothetical protein